MELKPKSRTGLVYHPDTLLHALSLQDEKTMLSHPENPRRLESIITHLNKVGLKDRCDTITNFDPCSSEYVQLAHPTSYFEYVDDIWMPCSKESVKYKDTYYNSHSGKAARLAASGVKLAVDKIMRNEWDNAFAAVRPPGHHAETNGRISGFCFFNNVALGVRHAQEKYGVKRIAIFDWDAHHGDSTQRIFEEDPNVLFISFHRHDNGLFFPGMSGAAENVGKGKGEGFCLNLPWNIIGCQDYRVNIHSYS